MTILGENYDERYGLDEYDPYDPYEGEDRTDDELKQSSGIKYRDNLIVYNFYGKGEYTVFYGGDDLWFTTEQEAMDFIDTIA